MGLALHKTDLTATTTNRQTTTTMGHQMVATNSRKQRWMGILGREGTVGGNLSAAVGVHHVDHERSVARVPRLETGPCGTESAHSPRQRARGQTHGAEVDIAEEWSREDAGDAGGRAGAASASGVR